MKKEYIRFVTYLFLLILAGGLLVQLCRNSNQSTNAFAVAGEFQGEYRLGDGEWKPLKKGIKFNSFGGDLVLRGNFAQPLPLNLLYYLDHIGMTISVNQEEVFCSGRTEGEIPEMMCGSFWGGWYDETVTEDDEIEIRLHNPHKYGNAGAYNEFLDSLCYGSDRTVSELVKSQTMPYRIAGIFIIVVSVALLGMALGYFGWRIPFAGILWCLGLTSLCFGGYILMDTVDLFFYCDRIVFNTFVRYYCIMFALLALSEGIAKTLTGKEKKMADGLTIAMTLADGGIFLLSLLDIVSLYDTGIYWAAAQAVASLGLICLNVRECKKEETDKILLVSYIILSASVILELINARTNIWTSGIVVKAVFVALFVFHLVRAVKRIAINHQASIRAKKLEEELKNSRIDLAMSQIKPHFICNALGAIRGLCMEDKKKAVEAIDHFSGFLRVSLETMGKKQCIPFHSEMELVDNYLYLEQCRFGDQIKVKKDIAAEEDFMIPPMTIQPVVENAIRHGIRKKQQGGTVSIRSRAEETEYLITVADDGDGFDMSAKPKDGRVHVGLQNVEKRLKLMCKGSMKVESVPGKGTVVTIHIPKNRSKKRQEG
ncbi:MAG: histidine kinase [Clostridiales bacterium]|nr:histidine kinase [Clostridiales bacterium]